MGQKSNVLTLRKSEVNLNLYRNNSLEFLYGYTFLKLIEKLLTLSKLDKSKELKKEKIDIQKLAQEIAGNIEENLQYPGEVKVSLIRETRCVEVAK